MSIGSMGLGLGITMGGASAGDEGGGAPEWVPEGAAIHSDFEDVQHWSDGAERALTDLWIEYENWRNFDPANVDAAGLHDPSGNSSPTLHHANGIDLIDLEDMSIVAEISCNVDGGRVDFITFDAPGMTIDQYVSWRSDTDLDGGRVYNLVSMDGPPGVDTRRKVGATFLADRYKQITAGGTMISAILSEARVPGPTEFGIWLTETATRVHRITIYSPALSDAALEALVDA